MNGPLGIALVAYVIAYLAAGVLIVRAWRSRTITTRTAALLRAARFSSIGVAVAAIQGWLFTPLGIALVAAMFAGAATLNVRMFAWVEPTHDGKETLEG